MEQDINNRQSFLRGEIDYRKYDDIFPVAAVQEDLDIVWEILAGRMLMHTGYQILHGCNTRDI